MQKKKKEKKLEQEFITMDFNIFEIIKVIFSLTN